MVSNTLPKDKMGRFMKGYAYSPLAGTSDTNLVCETCSIGFTRKRWEVKRSLTHYCSKSCALKSRIISVDFREKIRKFMLGRKFSEETKKRLSISHRKNKEIVCLSCKSIFYPRNAKGVLFCSKSCYSESQRRIPVNLQDRLNILKRSRKYAEFRDFCRNRDDWTCQNCGSKPGKRFDGDIVIEVNHRIPVRKLVGTIFEKYIFNPLNGITLCHPCHNLVPRRA